MSLVGWYLLALVVIALWTVGVMAVYARWKESLEKHSISVMGPFVMWKTKRGREYIERLASRRKDWVRRYGKLAVAVTGVSMVVMTFFLFLSAYIVTMRARNLDLEPHMLLGLPGLNPLIPLWYGIFALVIAMVVHEFSHGLLSALARVRIVSLGILLFILPMGAFVEPDEEGLQSIEKKKRVRMYSAGPAANIIMAGVFAVVFSLILVGGVQPVTQGVGIIKVGHDTAAEAAGIDEGMIMVEFNGTPVLKYADFSHAIDNTTANQTVSIGFYEAGSGTVRYMNVTLMDKVAFTNRTRDAGKGYLGVSTMTLSTEQFHPIGGSRTPSELLRSVSVYVTLPLQGMGTVHGPLMNFYNVTGFWSFLPASAFWVLANAAYWVFWLNLMVGLSNALPAVPLDGGYIFKDWLDSLLARGKGFRDKDVRKKAVDRIAVTLALVILFLILWQALGPKLMALV